MKICFDDASRLFHAGRIQKGSGPEQLKKDLPVLYDLPRKEKENGSDY